MRACLSNSKDALLSEALKLIVQFRLRGSEDDDIDDAREDDLDSVPEYVTLDSDAPSGKYASLFMFTSNRYHYTPTGKRQTKTTVPVNYEDAVVWEDVKRSGLVFWYHNKQLYSHLALKMAMVRLHRTELGIEPIQALKESVRRSTLLRCSSQADRVGISVQDSQE